MSERVKHILEGLQGSDRGSLARAITLLESRLEDDLPDKLALLDACEHQLSTHPVDSVRIAITGSPGVGKSSLINHIGMSLLGAGHRVAVLAVDPSSEKTGGSILGDKTRMSDLSMQADAFIRPSPTAGVLGGVAQATREAILICEAAGYDRIIIETVGVGQSEHQVHHVVDAVVFATIAGAGDGLQGIKRGILEAVDVVVVNKADGDNVERSEQHARELQGALMLLRGSEAPSCLTTSAETRSGIQALLDAVRTLIASRRTSGAFAATRLKQRERWFDDAIQVLLKQKLRRKEAWKAHYMRLLESVMQGETSPHQAANSFVSRLLDD